MSVHTDGRRPCAGARFWRRVLDILLALPLCILLLPLTLLVLLAVLLRSPGSPFYLQKRIGQEGRTIGVLKFRTMRRGAALTAAEQAEYLREYKLDDDPRLIGGNQGGRREGIHSIRYGKYREAV